MSTIESKPLTRWIAIGVLTLGAICIALAVLPVYSLLSTTSFPDTLVGILTRLFGQHAAPVVLAYTLGSLVSGLVALAISFFLGLVVPSVRVLPGLWMGLVAAMTFMGLALVSGVQPRLVMFVEIGFLVGACVAGLGAARWLRGLPPPS